MTTTLALVMFLLFFALILVVVSLGLRMVESQGKRKVAGLVRPDQDLPQARDVEILGGEEEKSRFDFKTLPIYRHLQETLDQGGLDWSPGMIAGATVGFACAGLLLGLRVDVPVFREFTMAGLGILLGGLPYLFIRWKRRKRLSAFEALFPEALDFLARSMRAGHAFSVSLETVAEESPEPIGFELRRVAHEQNLGSALDVSLKSLAVRIPLLDVSFFVAAILLQRETGGNLAEILTKLGYVIRERFRLNSQVKAASAHGRLTAIILSLMPILTLAALMVIAPEYLGGMAKDPDGKWIMVGVVIAQFLGYAWMRKIINIKV